MDTIGIFKHASGATPPAAGDVLFREGDEASMMSPRCVAPRSSVSVSCVHGSIESEPIHESPRVVDQSAGQSSSPTISSGDRPATSARAPSGTTRADEVAIATVLPSALVISQAETRRRRP